MHTAALLHCRPGASTLAAAGKLLQLLHGAEIGRAVAEVEKERLKLALQKARASRRYQKRFLNQW